MSQNRSCIGGCAIIPYGFDKLAPSTPETWKTMHRHLEGMAKVISAMRKEERDAWKTIILQRINRL